MKIKKKVTRQKTVYVFIVMEEKTAVGIKFNLFYIELIKFNLNIFILYEDI